MASAVDRAADSHGDIFFHDKSPLRGAFCVASAALRGHDARDRPLFTQQLPTPKSFPAYNAGIQNGGFSGSGEFVLKDLF